MRILICSPEENPATGNWVTGLRYKNGLERFSHQVKLCALSGADGALKSLVEQFRPDLLLLLHAFRSGRQWLSGEWKPIPALVMLSGTDINEGLNDPVQQPIIEQVLQRADGVLIQNALLAQQLRQQHPALSVRLHELPPAIELGNRTYSLRGRHGLPENAVLFLCPASIRPVKGVLALIELFDQLRPDPSRWRVAFCGPELDSAYSHHFLAAVDRRPWIHYLGVIPPDGMASAMGEADVIVNNSVSEGLPNALIEAACLGRPILASDIPGNQPIVHHGQNGLLFHDCASFSTAARQLIASAALRQQLSRPEPDRFSPAREAEALQRICLRICGPDP
ncbi:MAG: glycosyltransferase family 4 protein [Desulfuromonadaceae bacterium]|nr:glycosyltransferase family 4 protein [Desulfuromonadaceae bacterium]